MIGFFARLYRVVPFLIVLGVAAIIIYTILAFRYSSNRAKELMIKIFTWVFIVTSVFFLLASLYALLEDNVFVFEFFATCLACMVVGLIITMICRWRFLKNNPNYQWKPQEAHVVRPWLEVLKSLFGAFAGKPKE